MIFKQQKNKDHVFLKGGKLYLIKDIAALIREGYTVTILSEENINITKEFLLNTAMEQPIRGNLQTILLMEFTTDKLYDIIENGGLDNYLIRNKDINNILEEGIEELLK